MLELVFSVLLIILGWGFGDFLLATVAKKLNNPFQTAFWSGIVTIAFTASAYFFLFFPKMFPVELLWMLVVYAALVVSSFICFNRACSEGKISLVIPIASSYGVFAMVMSMIIFHESLTFVQLSGIIMATFGLVIATISFDDVKRLKLGTRVKGLKYAVLTFVLWGLLFLLASPLVKAVDWVTPFFFAGFLTLPVLFLLMKRSIGRFYIPPKKWLLLLLASSVMGQTAFFIYAYSLKAFPTALLAPLSAGYPVITLLLAHFFHRERLEKIQYLGVALIVAGVIVAAF